MSTRKIPIAIRTHTELIKDEKQEESVQGKKESEKRLDLRKPYGKRILVFDTETTTDIYQNLRYGQAFIIEGAEHAHIDGAVDDDGYILFYGDCLTSDEMTILKTWAKQKGALLMSRQEFIDEIFLDEILILGTVCVGFNLPFDLSRLAVNVKTQEYGKNKDKFELILSNDKYTPSILLEPIDSKKSFISTKIPSCTKQQTLRKHQKAGRFLDLRTLIFALTNESHSLASACKLYKVGKQKTEEDERGFEVISYENLNYNYNDTDCTALLYKKVMEEYYKHPIAESLEAGKAYSPASIGKAYYKLMGIKPLNEIQSDFSKDVLGYAMASYYGGRAECHYRGKAVKTFHTDVLSMYPSVFTLQSLWLWVIAEGFDISENTEEIKDYLNNITLEDLFKKESWLDVPALVQIKPYKDLLPVRAEYKDNYQIGLNYLTSDKLMWYTLADVIACKVLTGKIPEIVKVLKIIPRKPQELITVKIRGEIEVNPVKDNFFKKVIELRTEFKKTAKNNPEDDSMQMFLKILANSTSYGVYVELNREESKEDLNIEIYGIDSFNHKGQDYEKAGRYYNPLIATMITGGARLILAMIQKSVQDLGGSYTFCDTDSMNIIDLKNNKPDEISRQVIEKFKSLVPYENCNNKSLLQAEECNFQDNPVYNCKYEPLYCYSVSSKRYALYNIVNGEIIIRKQSFHGMGHLRAPNNLNPERMMNEVWKMNICREHNLSYAKPDWFEDVAFARQTISKPSILKMFNKEKGVSYERMIKPGNFLLVGYSANETFSGSKRINEFYCRNYKTIGYDICSNKSGCDYKGDCLANTHIIAITPFTKNNSWQKLDWIDKTTKQPLIIEANFNSEPIQTTKYWCNKESDYKNKACQDEKCKRQCSKGIIYPNPIPRKDNITYLKTYYDFIGTYHLHLESKLDDEQGNPSNKYTKGLLQPCYVIVTSVRHIGKEANTIGDEEDLSKLPEENLEEERLLEYEEKDKRVKKFEIDIEQWEALREILKDKAYPRKKWHEELDISERYFHELLSYEKFPSLKLYEKILAFCGIEKINVPNSKLSMPKKIKQETKGYIYPLQEFCGINNISTNKAKEIFKDWIFKLYEADYINCSDSDCQKIIEDWKIKQEQIRTEQKKNDIANLKFIGEKWENDGWKQYPFNIENIHAIRSRKQLGRNRLTLQVKLNNPIKETIWNVYQKDNELAFQLELLPKAKNLPIDEKNKYEINGRTYYYSDWYFYETTLKISVKKLKEHYKISKEQFQIDIDSGNFSTEDIGNEKITDKTLINPITAWKIYGKGEQNI